jgi:hypothetical protein
VTNEELDQARAEEAFEQSKAGDLFTDIAAHAARLAREGWMPLKAIEPDAETALALWDEYNKEEIEGLDELVLEAIKRGRELERAEAQPGMVWVKHDGSGKCPVGKDVHVWLKRRGNEPYVSRVYELLDWLGVTHYAIITQPEEK